MEISILEQIERAFEQRPGLDGTLHGVRRITQGKHGSRSSLFYSRKNAALMPVESRLERAACYQMEWENSVARYRTQAIRIPFGTSYIYPDICVQDANGTFRVIEVKPVELIQTRNNEIRFNFLKHSLATANISLSIVGWAECGSLVWRENIERIYDRGGRMDCNREQLKNYIVQVLAGKPEATWGELNFALSRLAAPPHILDAAIFYRVVHCELGRPLTSKTILRALYD